MVPYEPMLLRSSYIMPIFLTTLNKHPSTIKVNESVRTTHWFIAQNKPIIHIQIAFPRVCMNISFAHSDIQFQLAHRQHFGDIYPAFSSDRFFDE